MNIIIKIFAICDCICCDCICNTIPCHPIFTRVIKAYECGVNCAAIFNNFVNINRFTISIYCKSFNTWCCTTLVIIFNYRF